MSPKSLRRCSSSISNDSTYVLSVQDLRHRVEQDKICQKCIPSDLHRIKNEDWWLGVFLTSCNYDVDVAFSVLIECLRWRTNFGVERISLLSIKPLLDRQLMYIHGTDHMSNPILWINFANYKQEESEFEHLFVFWMDRHFMETKVSQLILLMDMTGTKLKQMDLNIFKFMLKAMKYYFPGIVQELLVFDSPPVLSAPWKVVKSWLIGGHPTIQHLNKVTIPEYIDTAFLRPHQGGTDNFIFTMNEIAKCLPNNVVDTGDQNENFQDYADSKANLDNFPLRRSVKFDDPDEAGRRTPLTLTRRPSKGPGRRVGLPSNIKPVAEKRMREIDTESSRNAFISVSPKDELMLLKIDGESDFVDIVAVKNHSTKRIMFKIKTTSPEKFRVRPSSGVIPAGTTEVIRVYLQNEYKFSCSKEKFLLMAVETENANIEQFIDVWKSTPANCRVEHKLKCKVSEDVSTDSSGSRPERKSSLLSSQQNAIEMLREQTRQTIQTQRLIIVVIGFLFAVQFIAMMYERSNYHALRLAIDTISSTMTPSEESAKHSASVNTDALDIDEDL